MIEWLRERRLMLLFVALAVPLTALICFWNVIRPNWLYWLVSYFVSFVAGTVVVWGFQSALQLGRDSWEGLGKRWRVLLRCLAIPALWVLLVFKFNNRSDGLLYASAITLIALLLWGAYAVFSRLIDWVWFRIHKQ